MKEAFTIDQINLTARRLRELRLEKGFSSVEKVANTLSERYGAGFSKDTLGNYERICDDASTRTNAGGMPIRTVYCLSEFYGVSVEYILGLSDNRTKDTELAAVCEYTGLSEECISCLRHKRESTSRFDKEDLSFISSFLQIQYDRGLSSMVNLVDLICEMDYIRKLYPNADLNDIHENFDKIDKGSLDERELEEYNIAFADLTRYVEIRNRELPFEKYRLSDILFEIIKEIAEEKTKRFTIDDYLREKRAEQEEYETWIESMIPELDESEKRRKEKCFQSIAQEIRLKRAGR